MQRYTALRTIAVVLKVLAWIVAVAGVIGSIFMAVMAVSGLEAIGTLIGGLLATAIYFVILLAAAEVIRVVIDIEQNTRDSAESLKQGARQ